MDFKLKITSDKKYHLQLVLAISLSSGNDQKGLGQGVDKAQCRLNEIRIGVWNAIRNTLVTSIPAIINATSSTHKPKSIRLPLQSRVQVTNALSYGDHPITYQQWLRANLFGISTIKKSMGIGSIYHQNANRSQYTQLHYQKTDHRKYSVTKWDGTIKAIVSSNFHRGSNVFANDEPPLFSDSSYKDKQDRVLITAQRNKYVYLESGGPTSEKDTNTIRNISIDLTTTAGWFL